MFILKIISEYNCTDEDNDYIGFVCELNKNTLLKLNLLNKDECKIIMEDKVSGIIDICATISNEDIKALIRTFRNVSVEMDKLNNKNECK